MINLRQIFKKEKTEMKLCACGNEIPLSKYNKRLKRHKIGVVYKDGTNFDLYCDGKERK